ncbi:NAD(P)-dependent dehydrogenase (short-subunit alcohol dehydrogenase family) [Saccharothrix carnea]|uniref:NAD(P)-dependent dehydrogenase (Short-subunit alcohol dehydrogenase family) n=1 Tax=Saccharothrix carnea TaxID=1280637 RepID=A0A2P8IBV4_SACCR|nr:SDR family NAD(P)-dependent oxidoreductase [Saccharothrix carnea]PSL55946.1 NAD(P)-dependent dehydrogenase (short-subunit alcohol dehydrogenase family) [Saccharothrix carnea]
MSTGTIVITGGNSGIGYAAASALLRATDGPWHVVVASRDAGRTRAAVDELARVTRTGHAVTAMALDLASLASVRSFATDLAGRVRSGDVPPLHAVVCNAGVQAGTTRTETADGFESTFGVNHLGHFLLVRELLPVLVAPARVVVVSSDTHDPARKLGVPAPAWHDARALARGELGPAAASDKPFAAGQRRYSTSKLANVYFTYALARRLPAGVTANAFNPGLVPGTGLQREAAAPLRFASKHVLPHLKWLLRRVVTTDVHTAAESGGALAWLATAPELADTTGRYFDGRRAVRSSDESYDVARADALWEDSVALTSPA